MKITVPFSNSYRHGDALLRDMKATNAKIIIVETDPDAVHYTTNADIDQSEQDALAAAIAAHGSLVLSATLPTITANGVQETVITSAGLMSFTYNIWKDGLIVLSGSVNDGSLDFSTNEAGVYLIEFISGNSTGYKEITANG